MASYWWEWLRDGLCPVAVVFPKVEAPRRTVRATGMATGGISPTRVGEDGTREK